MKALKRIIFSVFVLAGLGSLCFPCTLDGNMIRLISEFLRSGETLLVVWICGAVLLMAAAVGTACFGTGIASMWAAVSMAFVSGVSILVIPWIYNGMVEMPAWGTWVAEGSLFLAVCVGDVEIVQVQNRKKKANLKRETEEGQQPPAPAEHPEENTAPVEKQDTPGQNDTPEHFKGTLRIWCGPMAGSGIQLGHMESVVIGRDASASNLVVGSASVSRKHCIITYNAVNNTYLLLDISSNGTYFSSGQRIPKSFAMEVQEGTEFYLGTPENKFSVGR